MTVFLKSQADDDDRHSGADEVGVTYVSSVRDGLIEDDDKNGIEE